MKNLSLERRLLSYSATAGAVLLTSIEARAQIYGTDVNTDIQHGYYYFNFPGETSPFRIGQIDGTNAGQNFAHGVFTIFTGRDVSCLIESSNNIKGLASGYNVNATKNFSHYVLQFARTLNNTWVTGESEFRGQTKFIGFRLSISGERHYGWVKLSVNDDLSIVHIFSYAWEQTVDGGITADGNLPVELISFSAKKNNNNINLNWETSTEKNNYGFEIERNIYPEFKNGEKEIISQWEKIGFVNGSGSSNSAKQYSFLDESAPKGIVMYRLKQVDNDGTFSYSQMVTVDNSVPVKFELSQNYPNPFNPNTEIKFSLPKESDVKLTVYDALGTEISMLVNSKMEEGIHKVNFNAAGLPSGIYFYKLETNGLVETKKMVVLK